MYLIIIDAITIGLTNFNGHPSLTVSDSQVQYVEDTHS